MTKAAAKRLLIVACVVVLLVGAAAAHARRTDDFVPPPYLLRVLYALLGILPLAMPLALVSLFPLAFRSAEPMPSRLPRFLTTVALLVLGGAMLAALDGQNDESWQPWRFTSFLLAIVPALSCFMLARRTWVRALGVAACLPTWFVLALGGSHFQLWGLKNGLHTSW